MFFFRSGEFGKFASAVIPRPVKSRIPGQGAAGIEAEPDEVQLLAISSVERRSFMVIFSCWFTGEGEQSP